jgi:hypothetical protein
MSLLQGRLEHAQELLDDLDPDQLQELAVAASTLASMAEGR